MRTGSRLSIYGLGVVLVFGIAAAIGAVAGPIDVGASSDHSSIPGPAGTGDATGISGLAIAGDGYRLVPTTDVIDDGKESVFMFTIEGNDGSPLVRFDDLHERKLHLIVLSRNLVDYLHLHPTMDPGGLWRVQMPPLSAGSYRVYADFKPHGGDQITLASDVVVPGTVGPAALPIAASAFEVGDYSVSLSGHPVVGQSTLTFVVSHDGAAVVTEPHLGAAGHLVVIRTGDLGYLHVHPVANAQPERVSFAAEFPTPGTYRLFFDFSSGGSVRTASFTVDVAAWTTAASPSTPDDHESLTP